MTMAKRIVKSAPALRPPLYSQFRTWPPFLIIKFRDDISKGSGLRSYGVDRQSNQQKLLKTIAHSLRYYGGDKNTHMGAISARRAQRRQRPSHDHHCDRLPLQPVLGC